MKILLLLSFAFLSINVLSQSNSQQWEWAKSFGGSGNDSTVDIKIKNGCLYVTGNFSSTQINWENTILNSKGSSDIFVAKLDTNGNTIWVKSFGGVGNDYVTQLEINNSGTSVLHCKSSSSVINAGSASLENPKDFFIELNANGEVLNAKTINASVDCEDIDIDNQGGVYISGSYKTIFSFSGQPIDTSYSKAGAVILKYGVNGSEEWAKYIPQFNERHYPGDPWNTFNWQNNENITTSMTIEYCSFDNTIAFLNSYKANYLVLNLVGFSTESSTPSPRSAGGDFLSGKISINGEPGYFSKSAYPSSGSFGGFVHDFETGNTGLNFSCYSYMTLSASYNYIRRDYNETRGDTLKWRYVWGEPFAEVFPFSWSTLTVNENGDYIVINKTIQNNLEILDSNLTRIRKTTIPSFGLQKWNIKCMQNVNAIYFGDTYTNSSLTLNNDVQPAQTISLGNKGASEIFIGKYNTSGYEPLSLAPGNDRFKICTDSITPYLFLPNEANQQYRYHWQPVPGLSDTAVLQPRVFITSDSVISKLTITDTNGHQYSKDFVFFKGTLSDMKLMVSDTIVCTGDTVTLWLQGNNFTNCMFSTEPYQSYIPVGERTSTFESIGDTCKYVVTGTHQLQFKEKFRSDLPTSSFCINSAPVNIVAKSVYTKSENAVVCSGSNYIFPDGTELRNIISNVSHTSHLESFTFCDSAITTNVTVSSSSAVNQIINASVCAPGNFTFSDGTILTNIKKDTSIIRYYNAVNGCDSIITINIVANFAIKDTIQVALCPGSSYIFPDHTTQNNIVSNIIHVNHLTNPTTGCDSILTTVISVKQMDTSVLRTGLMLTANSGLSTYQWINCETGTPIVNETQQSYTASAPGSYAAILMKDGCTDTTSCYLFANTDFRTGGRPIVNLYPMPVRNDFTLTIESQMATEIELSLLDFSGNKITTEKINLHQGSNIITKNVSTLISGLYVLKLIGVDNGGIITKRFIKQ